MLRAVSERDAYANLALPALLRERGISGRDAAFATELTYGTCRTRGLLDAVIAAAAGRPPEAIDPVLLDLLRLGAYQLLRTRSARPRRGVHHGRTGRHRIRFGASGFRQRRAAHHRRPRREVLGRRAGPRPVAEPIGHAAFVHAHPRWIAQAFADALGAAATELDAVLASDDARPQVHLAARPGTVTAAELADAVGGTVGRYSPYAVYLPGGSRAAGTGARGPRWSRTRAASWSPAR